MEIPEFLITQVREGKVVLFLGSGASMDATDTKGKNPPSATALADMLTDGFLGGKYKGYPLNQIAEYAISESDLGTVQAFIRDIFAPFEPSKAHGLMTTFRWYGLATTNYDQVIEKAYSKNSAVQEPRPLIENTDRVEENLRDPKSILLLKLHGCISRISNPTCPLILTTDQYVEYRQGRDRLFDILSTWGYEHTIVFVGHSLQDADIRAVLLELSKIGDFRPRYFVVAPDVDEIKARFWEAKRVTPLKGTFYDFMGALDGSISSAFRGVGVTQEHGAEIPIAAKFKVKNVVLSKVATQFLQADVDYVNSITATETVAPQDFYKGYSPGFAAVEQALDVRRHLGDTILSDYFLRDPTETSDGVEVLLINAHAGAGKSVLLQRMAWDAARDYDRICLFIKPHGIVSAAALQELIGFCRERVFLFVDDAADRVRELHALFRNIGTEGNLLTVVMAERTNEWNVQGQAIAQFVTDEYELKYLSSSEIDGLLALLEKNHSLGTLEHLSQEQRKEALAQRAGRQLLVALHEATLGKPFEELLVDEYNNITPYEAQRIYLTICVLNRLNVPVRAGIIARIHHVPFEQFKEQFFAPLEHVVFADYDKALRDYVYRARHPHIADMVFIRVLSNVEERFDVYIRTLKALNVSYSTDWKAFWDMIRARNVLQLFPIYEMGQTIYKAARDIVGDDAHLFHQIGLFEMNRPNGSLLESSKLLNKAAELAPYDQSIRHSIAEHRLRSADASKTELERAKCLKEAAEISVSLISDEKNDSYAYHTLVKVNLKKLQDALGSNRSDSEVEKAVKEVQTSLSDGQQKFPGDPHLLEAEADFAKLLSDSERVRTALERAFEANPRNSLIALRLSRMYEEQGALDKSRGALEKALAANANEQRLHYAFAKILMKVGGATGEELAYHLRRSFTDGDSRYDAQLLYGRQLFLNNDSIGSRAVFKKLRLARLGPEFRNKRMYPLVQWFEGRIARIEASYCFIARDGSGDWIYAHITSIDDFVWKSLAVGVRVRFQIAFSIAGPNAFNLSIVGLVSDRVETQLGLFKRGEKS